ncbi:MAG TPA: M17 family peptidase N-terminal domain-containing protein, partial [Solirubrobacteraceae bacterium]|nr:M17 family peptidase N-terminal domain-containing protein [Solirubrobacteraceae bacterium]
MRELVLVSCIANPAATTDADTVAVGLLAGEAPAHTPPELAALIDSGEARSAFKALAVTHAQGKRWLLVGLGARAELTPERARAAAATAHERVRELSTRTLCWQAPADVEHPLHAALVEGTILASYR